MANDGGHDVTRLLSEARSGRSEAVEELFGLVYQELHSIASHKMRQERPGNVLQTTALVNEAYLRLFGGEPAPLNGREHFFRAASLAMRRVLIDISRGEKAAKRGGGQRAVPLEDWMQVGAAPLDRQIDFQNGIDALAQLDPRAAKVVELMCYSGRDNDEIAALLAVTRRTVERDLASARLFLKRYLSTHAADA